MNQETEDKEQSLGLNDYERGYNDAETERDEWKKREDTCQWTIDDGGSVETQCGRVLILLAYTSSDFHWCLYCGGDITGNGTTAHEGEPQ